MEIIKSTPRVSYPLYLLGTELDELAKERDLRVLEDGAEVIVYDADLAPQARYEKETYPSEIVFKRAEVRV